MISPGFNSCEHTLNTLRYSDRCLNKKKRGWGGGGGEREKIGERKESSLPPFQAKNLASVLSDWCIACTYVGQLANTLKAIGYPIFSAGSLTTAVYGMPVVNSSGGHYRTWRSDISCAL